MHHTTGVSHCTPFHITDVPHKATFRSHHWPHHLCVAPPHLAPHHILHNIAPHFTCSTSCIIPPHLTVIAPNSTSHYHVSHQYTTTFYIPPSVTSCTKPPPLPRRYRAVSQPTLHDCSTFHVAAHTLPHSTSHNVPHSMSQHTLYLIPHRTTFHIPCHSPHSTPFHTA